MQPLLYPSRKGMQSSLYDFQKENLSRRLYHHDQSPYNYDDQSPDNYQRCVDTFCQERMQNKLLLWSYKFW